MSKATITVTIELDCKFGREEKEKERVLNEIKRIFIGTWEGVGSNGDYGYSKKSLTITKVEEKL